MRGRERKGESKVEKIGIQIQLINYKVSKRHLVNLLTSKVNMVFFDCRFPDIHVRKLG